MKTFLNVVLRIIHIISIPSSIIAIAIGFNQFMNGNYSIGYSLGAILGIAFWVILSKKNPKSKIVLQ